MNVKAIKAGLLTIAKVTDRMTALKDKLPSGKDRDSIERLLAEAREQLKEAEARIAHEIGFPICKRCWPPEIMTHNDDGDFACPKCGQSIPDTENLKDSDLDDLATW